MRWRTTRTTAFTTLSLLVMVACGGADPAPGTGLEGTVLRGPMCPVEQAGSPCPDQPAAGVTLVFSRDGGEVARATTGDDGGYRVDLVAGSYDVTTTEAVFGAVEPSSVTVTAGRYTIADLAMDSGIR